MSDITFGFFMGAFVVFSIFWVVGKLMVDNDGP